MQFNWDKSSDACNLIGINLLMLHALVLRSFYFFSLDGCMQKGRKVAACNYGSLEVDARSVNSLLSLE